MVLTAGTLWRRLGGKGGGFFFFVFPGPGTGGTATDSGEGAVGIMILRKSLSSVRLSDHFCLMLLEVQEGSQSLCKLGKSSMWS